MIRDGYEIFQHEKIALNKANNLVKNGIISLTKIEFIECNTCKSRIPIESDILDLECKSCQKRVYSKKIITTFKMKISEDGVFDYLIKKLSKFSSNRDKGDNTINIEFENKKGKVVLLDFCYNTFLFEPNTDDFVVRIKIDDVQTKITNKGIDHHKFCELEEIVENKVDLEKVIKQIFAKDGIKTTEDKLIAFNTFVSNLDPQGKKLEQLTQDLLLFIQKNKSKVNEFMIALERDQNNIFGAKIVRLGGAGQTDLIAIPLYLYLLEFLQSDKNFECKSYPKSTLTTNDIGSSFVHLQRTGKKGISYIVITEKISPELWVMATQTNSSPRIIIIDRFILLRILNGIDAFQLIANNLNINQIL